MILNEEVFVKSMILYKIFSSCQIHFWFLYVFPFFLSMGLIYAETRCYL